MRSEFSKSFHNSALQLFLLALVIYGFTCFAGPTLVCGAGNTHIDHKVFQCASGDMSHFQQLVLLAGIALASLCAGRAMSLLQAAHCKTDESQ